ncbi:NAD(P)H-dependent glycerol-3-phosphate dehydrogenase [Bacillus sp. FSL K6-3431]|uniref:NAD(P)H-dependent glycerol-3-phosphate dehydrogenase n=1 Tax=Bacillus sp. FSL K6-3431 TaxID=2921500 RepID=UPI0030F6382B
MQNKKEKIAVIGSGSWGTALALVLADNNHQVALWTRNSDHASAINSERMNKKYLPGIQLPETIHASTSLEDVLENTETVVIAVPTKAIRDMMRKIVSIQQYAATYIHVSKGIEPDSLMRISEMIEQEVPQHLLTDVVVLSGPSHAEEVGLRHPTTVTVSAKNMKNAEKVQDLFMNQHFRVYTNPDLIGVEIGGALKNIIALAAGISDGLGYGDNAKAALITRGLSEISRLGTKMGANPLTFSGLAGIGDLIVTCTSVHSRNWRAGNLLGKGQKLEDVLNNMGMAVEGVRTTKAAHQLAKKYQANMPITEALYGILFNGVNSKAAVDRLMGRLKTNEMEDLVDILSEQLEQ